MQILPQIMLGRPMCLPICHDIYPCGGETWQNMRKLGRILPKLGRIVRKLLHIFAEIVAKFAEIAAKGQTRRSAPTARTLYGGFC